MATFQGEAPSFKDFVNFSMYGKPVEGAKRSPQLLFGAAGAFPRITVFTGETDAQGKQSRISAGFSPKEFLALLHELKRLANEGLNSKEELPAMKRWVECFTTKRDEEGKRGEKFLAATVYYGRDKDGQIWISPQAPEKARVKFLFEGTEYHNFFDENGNQFSLGRASSLMTISMIEGLLTCYQPIFSMPRQPANTGAPAAKTSPKDSAVDKQDFDDITF